MTLVVEPRADSRGRGAVSREPCVLVWSEVIRLTKAEPKGLHTGGHAIGTDTTGRLSQLSCGRAGKEQVVRDPDS